MARAKTVMNWRSETRRAHRQAVDRVIRTMHERLDQEFSLDDMASVALISPYHFNRVFRQLAGIPPRQFLSALRLQAAKRLLLTTDMSVTDVCFEVGYNSLGTFTRRFSSLVGLPPQRFRRLAESRLPSTLQKLEEEIPLPEVEAEGGAEGGRHAVHGHVSAAEEFHGLIFVGFFPSSIPQGRPLAGTLLSAPGEFVVPQLPDGEYYLFGAALSRSDDTRDYLLYENILRGGSRGEPIEVRGGAVKGSTDLELRRAELIDPPILVTLPLLVQEKLAEVRR